MAKLLGVVSGNDTTCHIDQYLIDTFNEFLRNETDICMKYDTLYGSFKSDILKTNKFLGLFLFKGDLIKEWNESKFKRRDPNDYTNLIKPVIFRLYPNVTNIYINIGVIMKGSILHYHLQLFH